jgi:hypothetical protein
MADSDKITSNPLAQTANPQRVLTHGTTGIISFGPYRLLAPLRRLEQAGRPVPLGDPEFDLPCTDRALPVAKATAHSGTVTSSMRPSRRCELAGRALPASLPGACREPLRSTLALNQPRGNVFQLRDERSMSLGGSFKLCFNHLSQLSGSTIPLP